MRASDLAVALEDATAGRLAALGWERVPRRLWPPLSVGQFTLGLHDGFVAVARLGWHGPARIKPAGRTFGLPDGVQEFRSLDRDASSLEVTVGVGVGFQPLTRLFEAIGGWNLVELAGEDVKDLDPPPNDPVVRIEAPTAMSVAAERAVKLIDTYAIPFAEQYASLERLLDLLGDVEAYEPDEAAVLRAALLTAARRWEQASDAVAALESMGEDDDWEEVRRRRRIKRQLRRLIDAEGRLSIPQTPARWPSPRPSRPRVERRSFGETWARARYESTARREALDAVRAMADGKNHEEIKTLLEQEQSRRKVDVDALRLTWQARQIEDERAGSSKAATLLDGVLELVSVGRDIVGGIRRAIREEDQHPPLWLQTPDRAAYPVRAIGEQRWVEVTLDPDGDEWLARVAAQTMKIGHVRLVEVWMDREQPSATDGQLAVHIGPRRVGMLTSKPAQALRPALDAAAERDELPFAEGRLTVLKGPLSYLLEIALPPVAQSAGE